MSELNEMRLNWGEKDQEKKESRREREKEENVYLSRF